MEHTYDCDELKNNFKNNVISRMSMRFNDDAVLSELKMVLDFALYDYQLSPAKNEIVIRKQQSDDELIKLFLIQKKIEGCTDRTLKMYGNTLKSELHRYIEKSCLEMGKEDMRYFIARKMMETSITPVSLNNIRRVFSTFFKFLHDNDYISKDPMRSIKMIKEPVRVKNPLSNEEVDNLRKDFHNDLFKAQNGMKRAGDKFSHHDDVARCKRDLAIFETFLSTGCRVTEICTAKLSNLNLLTGELKVIGKGNKERICFLNSSSILALKDYLNDELVNEIRKESDSDWLFMLLRNGNNRKREDHVKPSGIEIMFREKGKSLGIEKVHPHRFRRTVATGLLRKGMKLEEVQKILGHSNIETTLIYAQVDTNDVKSKHNKLMG